MLPQKAAGDGFTLFTAKKFCNESAFQECWLAVLTDGSFRRSKVPAFNLSRIGDKMKWWSQTGQILVPASLVNGRPLFDS